jgi:hypothetical protein
LVRCASLPLQLWRGRPAQPSQARATALGPQLGPRRLSDPLSFSLAHSRLRSTFLPERRSSSLVQDCAEIAQKLR